MEKLIITAAMVGAEVTRADNPNLPITPREIADAAYDCFKKGASIIHLHVKDKDGNPSQDPAVFAECEKLIREKTDLIVQYSTGGSVGTSLAERAAPLKNNPEMATLTTGTVNFGEEVFYNDWEVMETLAREMQIRGVKPEFEIFDAGMINNALQLAKAGFVNEPIHFDFVMGVPGGIPASVKNLLFLAESLPLRSSWTVAAIGRFELPLSVMAMIMGGHVRVGFEDNIYYSKNVLAESNAQLVERVARIAKELGREVAAPSESRAILGMPPLK